MFVVFETAFDYSAHVRNSPILVRGRVADIIIGQQSNKICLLGKKCLMDHTVESKSPYKLI